MSGIRISRTQIRMCKTKRSTDAAEPAHRPAAATPRTPQPSKRTFSGGGAETSTSSGVGYTSGSSFKLSSGADSIASRTSLSSIRDSLPENPHIYDFREISAATNNFLAKRHGASSSSSQSWRCVIRGKDAIVFQRKFRRKIDNSDLRERLAVICRSHHTSVVNLLGASVSGDHIYLVYDFLAGASLADCLRNPRNPNFTVLDTWISRIQIAADLAHGLDYVHNKTGLAVEFVHNRIKSTSVLVADDLRARLCHFGAAQLCGEVAADASEIEPSENGRSIFEGTMGYMSPEFRSSGVPTRESDVYAFGVVVLELLSGVEPVKYRLDKAKGEFVKSSVIESAMAAVENGAGRLRQWVDGRLKDSFPVDVAEKLTRVALECVHVDPDKRPNMGRVAGKFSKLFLDSKTWANSLSVPTGISVSMAPR